MIRTAPSRSLRLRLTALATLAIAVAVSLATAVLLFSVVHAVRGNVTTTLNAYADSISRSGTNGTWPKPLPSPPGGLGAWAQVVDVSGTVLASTANVAGQPARYTLPPGSTTPRISPASTAAHVDERVIAQRHVSGTTPVVIYVGGSTELLSLLTSDLQGHLLYALPLVLVGAVGMSWLLIGRTLRPVERIRAEAAEITGSDLHRRIPQPAGNDEIGRLTHTLNTMLDRLESSASRQRRFVADASHELRTPLAAMRTSLEVGLAHPDRAPWPELAERAVTETTRLQRLVEQLLLLARSDDDTLVSRREPVDLTALVQAAIDAAPSQVPVTLHRAEDVHVLGDPDQLTRLIRNLLDNADRHAHEHVDVTVTTQAPDTAVIAVADDGPGIPVEDRERIFNRFVRLQSARTRHAGEATGAGLGLPIVRDIATAHGGSLTVQETYAEPARGGQGPGATFTVLLPTLSSDTASRPGSH
ncbi:cell wall metabolism sensor histidine kinase WalK [Streptomyces sp. TP-A0356]|uniref:sensor histidine kinase n=1 Tax=Streptomyces sp. TP-A0356 TaxID=1359208 RepID=UPI0006E16961|nr:HAMP domain-containing sensor histidine kinase [Streptomyces sp. TP-A0356]